MTKPIASEHTQAAAQGTGPDCAGVPFIIGITGHMDLAARDREAVRQTMQRLFAWLRRPAASHPGREASGSAGMFSGPGLGLAHTPLMLLSSLAPGADLWIAQCARDAGVHVVAPLPFLREQYARASTFRPPPPQKPSDPTDAPAMARWEEKRRAWDAEQPERDRACEEALAFLAGMPPRDVFLVRLPGEANLPEAKLREDHEDPELLLCAGRRAERNERYGAAGEYVAAYSDLFLVLADPIDRKRVEAERMADPRPHPPDVGAHGIADIRRRGLTPGRLPIRPTLTWADSGPVLRITAYRRSTPVTPNQLAEAGAAEWLFPFDTRPADRPAAPDDDPRWQAEGLREVRDFARNLDALNGEPLRSKAQKMEEEWLDRLQPKRQREPDLFPEPALLALLQQTSAADPAAAEENTAAHALRQDFQRIGRLRRCVADLNSFHDVRLRGLRILLFAVALVAAFLLAGYEAWHFSSGHPLPQPERLSTARWMLFVASLVFTVLSFLLLRWFHGEARDRMRTDYRAIAEGLRVQFYWAAAGTGQSVSSTYLQRQRGELSWIRAVISSAAFPYERAATAFATLREQTQLALLRNVRHGWLGEQAGYYADRVQGYQDRRHAWSELGLTLIWTALVLNVVGFVIVAFPGSKARLSSWSPWLALAGAVGGVLLAVWAGRTRRRLAQADGPRPPGKRKTSSFGFVPLVGGWYPRFGAETTTGQRLGVLTLGVGCFVLIIMGICFGLGGTSAAAPLPSANNLLGFFKAMTLSCGLLAGLWVSAHFLTDNIHRYGDMAALFAAAGRRLDDHLNALDRALRHDDKALARQALRDSQELIVDIGREALFENAEWLAMHRDRPIEPVSA